MAELGLTVIDRAVNDANEWINDLSTSLSCDKQAAYHGLRAGLHTLRDRLTVEEAADFGAQLPQLVRGIYYEGWRPADTPQTARAVEDYVASVGDGLTADKDPEPRATAVAVFDLLKSRCDAGQMSHIRGMLPGDVAETLYDAA